MLNKKKRNIYLTIFLGLIILSGSFFWLNDNQPKQPPRRGGAYHSLKMMNGMRSYPHDEVYKPDLYHAWTKVHQPGIKKKVSDDEWQSMGPVNLGGRTLCIAFNPQNPNTIYAGSASGGLWRSFSVAKVQMHGNVYGQDFLC